MSAEEHQASHRTRLAKLWIPSLVAVLMAAFWYHRGRPGHGGGARAAPRYLVSGSFASSSLYLLRYEREARRLEVVRSVPGHGPHQYLYIDRPRHRLYATSWSEPARLSAWSILSEQPGGPPRLALVNQAPITAVSSYISSKHGLLLSVGGPTGEIHSLDPLTGAIGEKRQELLFVARDALENEDKSRKALRNGSHAIEVSSLDQVFVPHLGHNSIWMYKFDVQKKTLEFSAEVKSLHAEDGPRHAVISEDGERLYVVTEHTSRVDLYQVSSTGLVHQASSSILDPPHEHLQYRGDTVRIVPASLVDLPHEYVFATTRGIDPSRPGLLAVFEYNTDTQTLSNLLRWETPTSGGKANAIELSHVRTGRNVLELVLTDDQLGALSIVQCDLDTLQVQVVSSCLIDEIGVGASHAVWI
ncbi:hypothetical protein PtA15_12A291 [Puccinia triticina]|uniref:Uncharacterized protein n=1 Tax=Puccinia triticina TaxID=208348 RepID=A0ABY7CZG8_9BASI|nr:uncharacterized protein PtA15_12A291 [Puccinia triticina]WAQ90303.1 hypothetical protein PtA15_12A291 [Puccinia triticina]WAR61609.1 hypothetical protein PtB15_12B299 [Puccinia triticina]